LHVADVRKLVAGRLAARVLFMADPPQLENGMITFVAALIGARIHVLDDGRISLFSITFSPVEMRELVQAINQAIAAAELLLVQNDAQD
jgi:hypothetical protein